LRSLGEPVPAWQRQLSVAAALPPLLIEYADYRRAHNGIAESTLVGDLNTAKQFLNHLRRRGRPLDQIALVDIDAFIQTVAARVSTSKVMDTCSSLRGFLRFLQMTGRQASDLASGVMAPRFRASARPPRTLPWRDVRRILGAIRRSDATGKRDFAMLLLLATYGPWCSGDSRPAPGGPGLECWSTESLQAQNKGPHPVAAVATGRQGVGRIPQTGATSRQRHHATVLEQEDALHANNQWRDSPSHPAVREACGCFGEGARGSHLSSQPCEQAD
jgi:hypothetical protein